MKINFSTKLKNISEKKYTRVILSLDLNCKNNELLKKSISLVRATANDICAVKINYHLLLPLSFNEIKKLISVIHKFNLLVIADLKLNDISSTYVIAIKHLWKMGFDAVIVNPFVGYSEGLESLLKNSKANNKGVIFLVYMSHVGAKEGYGLKIIKNGRKKKLYVDFAERAKRWHADGIVIGATNPRLIKEIANITHNDIDIFTPGVGKQGGNEFQSIKSGANYIIVGRSIINSKNPSLSTSSFKVNSWSIS